MYNCTTATFTRTNVLRCIQRGCCHVPMYDSFMCQCTLPVPMYSVEINGGAVFCTNVRQPNTPVPMYSAAFNGGARPYQCTPLHSTGATHGEAKGAPCVCLKSRRGPLTSGNRIKCPHVRCTQRRPTPHCVKSTSYNGRQCGTPVPMYSVAVNGGAFNVSCANALCPYQCTPLQSTGANISIIS